MRPKLTDVERTTLMPPLERAGWVHDAARDAIQKRYIFDSFQQAMAFMTGCASMCDQLDHHPEWTNVYSRVDVTLVTHDAEGLTELDVTRATHMDRVATEL